MRDALNFDPKYGAGADSFAALQRLVDRIDPGYRERRTPSPLLRFVAGCGRLATSASGHAQRSILVCARCVLPEKRFGPHHRNFSATAVATN